MTATRKGLVALLALLMALLLAGCSGGVSTDDTDGDGDSDEIEGGGEIDDDEGEDNDAPASGFLATVLVVAGVAGFLLRRKA